ncbi:FtsH protease activity modulator HflK [Pseudoteredinibacter isoporae]|uniref:Protein HflK n=1 Tax=Pseudoteredinibacter isoporae TaxID=570281 RepID=A0A7X0JQY0_9GAMM|nr:FtsH protease activity modulator HflK [Pseudoteredinibacter isoporae]MBB6520677.1 membrane protease subunit HflK [Pseudoteredinibacter isoporae]NHO86244.1 FtsH protease activity modulator HflK [Pseudoteredinibacter isoporae]NIB25305.1 FtsH protease activity modulator HflK [Pseudoteredinibacter isoporae]
MAWNEPGGNNKDPWGGGGNRGGGNNNDGPPDLDEVFKKVQDRLDNLFGNGGGKNSGNKGSGLPLMLIFIVLGVFYIVQSFYQIDEQERGVVLRLGEYNRTLEPGLKFAPALIDQVIIVNVTKQRVHSAQSTMLTKDENIVQVDLSVQYNIADPVDYTLRVRNPDGSLVQATDSALRHVVGSSRMDDVLTVGREKIAQDVQLRLQDYLDNYQTGILVSKVNMEGVEPPREVQDAFDDVIKAREDKTRTENEAQAYANGIIPEARGKAQRMVEEANAYQAEVVSRAKGEAERFTDLLVEYQKAPEVTRERMYLDAVEQVMSRSSKVMIDVEGGNNMLYLPLDKIAKPSASYPSSQVVSPDMVRDIKNRVIDELRRDAAANRRREAR